jgi:hypothetical protein
MKFLERAAGKLRPKTIRLRLRTFLKFQCWLRLASGVNFPSSIVQVTDYVEERFAEPCPRTVPQSVLDSLAFMEDKGGVARQDRLSLDPSLLNTIQCMTKDLEKYSTLTAKAPPHLIVTMISLELYVCNVEHEAYPRAFAWLKLVKIWAALRTDDVAGLWPGCMLLTSRGLQGWLDRTKTSGAGRRIRWMPIFVSCNAWFVLDNWLEKGWDLWKDPKFAGVRDYFLPLPTSDLTSTRPIPASYHDQMVASKTLYTLLKVPEVLFNPLVDGQADLVYEGADYLFATVSSGFIAQPLLAFWKEHSERKTLNGMAAQLDIPKCERDFLGRWIPEQSDDYLLTSRSVVSSVQDKIATAVREGSIRLDETETLEAMRRALELKEVPEFQIVDTLRIFDWLKYGFGTTSLDCKEDSEEGARFNFVVYPDPVLGEAMSREEARWIFYQSRMEQKESFEALEDDDAITDQFIINTTAKTRTRCLHLIGGCWRRRGFELKNYEEHYSLEGLQYDMVCKSCWPEGPPDVGGATIDEEDDSSSSSMADDSCAI